jgi:Helix-turn-helix domain
MLGCSPNGVYRLIAGGELQAVNIAPAGSQRPKTRIRRSDLKAFIDARTQGRTS